MSTFSVVFDTSRLQAALKGMDRQVNDDTRRSLSAAAALLRAEAKANASGPPREKEGSRVSAGTTRSGRARTRIGGGAREGGPGVRTGRLRAGIKATGVRKTRGGYVVQVGASASTPYARSMELHNPRWKRKGGYPFLTPAFRTVRPKFAKDIRVTWAAAITGGAGRSLPDG